MFVILFEVLSKVEVVRCQGTVVGCLLIRRNVWTVES